MLEFKIDTKYGKNFGLYIAKRPAIPTPKQKIDSLQVDFRDGELTTKKGYSNINFPVEFNIMKDTNIKKELRYIKAWIINAETFQLTDDNVYYKVKYVIFDNIENEIDNFGYFIVNFICDPFQYAISESLTITSSGTLNNTGTYLSLPKITVYGSGKIVMSINGENITLTSITDYIVIDSEIMDAYRLTTNLNSRMTGEFPIFQVGNNTISWTGMVTKIVVEPRWRYI